MSLHPTRSSSASESSSRRPSGQPKSGRKQYSACGACRLRRVRCDLRELQEAATGGQPQICTNCSERGINCVDEYVELKAARRQIARIQKSEDSDGATLGVVPMTSPLSTHSSASPERHMSPGMVIPLPHSDFFRSTFFRHFSLQNPIFDPSDFQFIDTGNDQISIERKLLAMVVLAWAASFGIDEYGITVNSANMPSTSMGGLTSQSRSSFREAQRMRTDTLVGGILSLVDTHGLLRNPTWDGARLLLLVWPLTQGTQRTLERTTMFESIVSQVHALCRFGNDNLTQPSQDRYNESISRARVFGYAYTHEGITNALKGGRLVMNEDDLEGFQHALPAAQASIPSSSALPNAMFQTFGNDIPSPYSDVIQAMAESRYRSHSRTFLLYQLTTHHFDLTLEVATVCRRIHTVLTGPRARQLASDHGGSLNANDLRTIWGGLGKCWDKFEATRESGLWNAGVDEICPAQDVDAFASGWQIFLFECHNIIREALKQRILHQPSTGPGNRASSSAFATASIPHASSLIDLHMHATHNCRLILPTVLTILKRHLQASSALIPSDTGLIRDGCAFAGFMLAHGDLEGDSNGESLHSIMTLDEGMEVCLRTLGAMRWTFSDSAKTRQTLMNAWEARKLRDTERHGRQPRPAGQRFGPQPGSSGQWSSQSPHHGQPFEGYDANTTPSSSSSYYSQGQNYETPPWIYSSSSEDPGTQATPNIGSAYPSSTLPSDDWFDYSPTH